MVFSLNLISIKIQIILNKPLDCNSITVLSLQVAPPIIQSSSTNLSFGDLGWRFLFQISEKSDKNVNMTKKCD